MEAACFRTCRKRTDLGMSENGVQTPNEIAIFHRDNDQQNHWVFWGTQHFQTNPLGSEPEVLCQGAMFFSFQDIYCRSNLVTQKPPKLLQRMDSVEIFKTYSTVNSHMFCGFSIVFRQFSDISPHFCPHFHPAMVPGAGEFYSVPQWPGLDVGVDHWGSDLQAGGHQGHGLVGCI